MTQEGHVVRAQLALLLYPSAYPEAQEGTAGVLVRLVHNSFDKAGGLGREGRPIGNCVRRRGSQQNRVLVTVRGAAPPPTGTVGSTAAFQPGCCDQKAE